MSKIKKTKKNQKKTQKKSKKININVPPFLLSFGNRLVSVRKRGRKKGRRQRVVLDLSLANSELYAGCEIEEVAGRLNLKTPVAEAVNIVGRNVANIVKNAGDRSEVELTGPMAVWAYLVVFHAVVHSFNRVYYNDGRGNRVLVAAHG